MSDGWPELRLLPAGERGLVVEMGNEISPRVNSCIRRLTKRIARDRLEGLIEVVPSYRSLLIYFDPFRLTRSNLIEALRQMLASGDKLDRAESDGAREIHVPVCYGGEFGPDLEHVARHNGLTLEEVIAIHSSRPYLIYMLGFTPGFPYLGGMSEKIATPRLEKPRARIPRGSVGIAGAQTGLYPIESPGGWQLIGRTPLIPFLPAAADPFLFAAGDYLRFHPVSAEEYHRIGKAVEEGSYAPEIGPVNFEGVSDD